MGYDIILRYPIQKAAGIFNHQFIGILFDINRPHALIISVGQRIQDSLLKHFFRKIGDFNAIQSHLYIATKISSEGEYLDKQVFNAS